MNGLSSTNSGQTVVELLHLNSRQLETALNLDYSSARIEVQCLLQAVLQVSRAWLLTYPEHKLDDERYARYAELFKRRLLGEPVAYLLGEHEFFGLIFKVSPATLIPRPDTELLVELALQRIPLQGRCRILDIGTGSGAIALSIAHARPDAEVVAVDASPAALEIAQLNVQRLSLKNVMLLRSDWFSALHGERFDIIVSNPPYISSEDEHLSQGDVRFEPQSALVSGTDGLDDIRHICAQAKDHLNANGWLLLEHGYDQASQVRALLQLAGFSRVFSGRDLAEIERVGGGLFTPM